MKPFFGWGMLKSMGIAYKNLFRKKVTVQYPHERFEIPERARWAVEMVLDDDGNSKCTGCKACERACPGHVIAIDVQVGEDKSRRIASWNYQLGSCIMCGFCVEACNFGAIRMGHVCELGVIDAEDLSYNLLEDVPVAKPARPAKAKGTAKDTGAAKTGKDTRTAKAADAAKAGNDAKAANAAEKANTVKAASPKAESVIDATVSPKAAPAAKSEPKSAAGDAATKEGGRDD